MPDTLADALRILSRAHHRGAWGWIWNAHTLRAEPWGWSGDHDEPAPEFTAFEAVAIARGLVGIGAGGQSMTVDIPGG